MGCLPKIQNACIAMACFLSPQFACGSDEPTGVFIHFSDLDTSKEDEAAKDDSGNDSTPSLFSELPLSGPRGSETPSGKKYGRYCENGFERAGFPNCVGHFAKPGVRAENSIGYVGGGSILPIHGERRKANEGTFGMDYAGHFFQRKTWLLWSHGSRYQGGAGRYETEGPRILPE